jgi:hypothetical protein
MLTVLLFALSGCKNDKPQGTRPSATTPAITSEGLPGGSPFKTRNCRARCEIMGMCFFDEKLGRCVARSADDCQKARTCKQSGACTFMKEGYCAGTSDEDCKRSVDCKERGLCKRGQGGSVSTCRAAEDADCETSAVCSKEGKCSPVDGLCQVADDDDCKRSELCKKDGLCSAEDNPNSKPKRRCAARGKDCKASDACKKDKRCTAKEGQCVAEKG